MATETDEMASLGQQFRRSVVEIHLLAEELHNKIKRVKAWSNHHHELTKAAAETRLEHLNSLTDKYSEGYFRFRTLSSLRKLTESEETKVAATNGNYEAPSPDGLDCIMWLKQQMEDAQSQATRADSTKLPFRLPELKIPPLNPTNPTFCNFQNSQPRFMILSFGIQI